ncbi:MAG: hypothetical protein CGU28_14045 [Candidatus Dactylopiibacterium carminicum]|nr:MAG: hypothetical protein CGU28_14045 [Candidatus Dactylopiibacterium carminicum]
MSALSPWNTLGVFCAPYRSPFLMTSTACFGSISWLPLSSTTQMRFPLLSPACLTHALRPSGWGRLACLLAFGLLYTAPFLAFAETRALLILSDTSPAYQAFAEALGRSLGRASPAIRLQILPLSQYRELPPRIEESESLIITAGTPAAEALVERGTRVPRLMSLITRASHARLAGNRTGGVYIDQPPSRYVALVRAALPHYERIGLLVGRDSEQTANAIASTARTRGLQVLTAGVHQESDIHPGLRGFFEAPTVLLALPDDTVFNARTLPGILLASFRWHAPTVGYSPAYVSAGAVVALYSPEQIAVQTASQVLAMLSGTPPAAQYPQQYTIGVNARVASSLGLQLDDEASIRARLEKLERQQ